MHMAVFLPVPLHQLFPSGGLITFKTIKAPSLLVGLFFCPDSGGDRAASTKRGSSGGVGERMPQPAARLATISTISRANHGEREERAVGRTEVRLRVRHREAVE